MKTQDSYKLRWRGRQIGPLTLQAIEEQLEDQELGMLHEIFYDNQWKTLSEFFVEICRERKAAEVELNGDAVSPTLGVDASRATDRSPSSRQQEGARLASHGITKTVVSSGKEITLLENITFVIEPNEFVAILGPSGSGKSTLMDAINGRRCATSGSVFINGRDLHVEFDQLRDSIGYVPQKDIVHLPLTVRQELTFVARLRLPAEMPRETIDQIVSEVIVKIGLKERQRTRNANLSGGQLKRVSVGVELLANPTLLFLDEATSGLDAGTEARMMTLFDKLANEGKTIVCITHNLENLGLCDLAVVLACGKLVYYGPPGDLLTYFNVGILKDIFQEALGEGVDPPDEALKKKLAAQWAARYRSSEYYQRYVALRLQQKAPPATNTIFASRRARRNGFLGGLRQFLILTQRYATVTFQDRKNIFLLLAQAPVVALLIAIAFPKKSLTTVEQTMKEQTMITFFMTVSAIWFGCSNAAREIVKELPIYLRERAINLCLPAYLGSKMAVLSILCLLQCIMMFFMASALTEFRPDVPQFVGILVITALCAMMLGLLVSACAPSDNIAMAIVPVLLIPQLLFADAVVQLSGLAKNIAYYLIVSFWSFDGLLHSLGRNFVPKPHYDLPLDVFSLCLFFAVFVGAAVLALKIKDKST